MTDGRDPGSLWTSGRRSPRCQGALARASIAGRRDTRGAMDVDAHVALYAGVRLSPHRFGLPW